GSAKRSAAASAYASTMRSAPSGGGARRRYTRATAGAARTSSPTFPSAHASSTRIRTPSSSPRKHATTGAISAPPGSAAFIDSPLLPSGRSAVVSSPLVDSTLRSLPVASLSSHHQGRRQKLLTP